MRIAVIAWGSLVWDPRLLPIEGDWKLGGPELSIEFSRVSQDCRLTLVIDGVNGVTVPTRYSFSKRCNLKDAVADLRDREGTIWNRIGYVDIVHSNNSAAIFTQPEPTFQCIESWTKDHNIDATIWTALPPSFKKETGKDFSIGEATNYIKNLPKSAKDNAIEYLEKAPKEITTPLRNYLAREGIIIDSDHWGTSG